MHLSAPIPVIRIFSRQKAKDFYIDFVGVSMEWVHRFESAADLAWGRRMDVTDPFGNRPRFCETSDE